MLQKNLLAVALLSLLNTTLAQESVASGASAAASAATAIGSGIAQSATSRAASVISAATASGSASMSGPSGATSRMGATGAATAVGTATAAATRASSVAATSSFSLPETAPTGVVEGDYTGDLRPQVHFSPPVVSRAFKILQCHRVMTDHSQGFMNDPNGCFLDGNGTWHLYYQCECRDYIRMLCFASSVYHQGASLTLFLSRQPHRPRRWQPALGSCYLSRSLQLD